HRIPRAAPCEAERAVWLRTCRWLPLMPSMTWRGIGGRFPPCLAARLWSVYPGGRGGTLGHRHAHSWAIPSLECQNVPTLRRRRSSVEWAWGLGVACRQPATLSRGAVV